MQSRIISSFSSRRQEVAQWSQASAQALQAAMQVENLLWAMDVRIAGGVPSPLPAQVGSR
jgi:hypothetical protein